MENKENLKKGNTVVIVVLVVIVLIVAFYVVWKRVARKGSNDIGSNGVQNNTKVKVPGKKEGTPILPPPAGTYIPPNGPYQVETTFDIKYATVDGIDLYVDLYQPKGRTNTPVIVFSHGGGFITGTRKGAKDLGNTIAAHGYTLASIEYRFSNQAIYPAPTHDLNGAIRFLRANASKYSLDASRFALMGGSAGSILSSITGVTWDEPLFYGGTVGGNLNQPTKVLGVVDAFGSVESVDAGLLRFQQQDVASAELGCEIFTPGCETQSESFAPEFHLNSDDPAYFILNGEKDTVVPVEGAIALAADMKAADMDVTLVTDPKYGHGDDVTFAHMPEILAFLDRIFSK